MMIALDTNVLARLLLRDDERQYDRARQLLEQPGDFTAPLTVMLELVWVLEANDRARADIARGLGLLLGLANFKPQSPDTLRHAVQGYANGLDFADALHLACSRDEDQLATFDKAFARKAQKLGLLPPVVGV